MCNQTAKILKYFKYELSCNIAFGVFMVTWLIARHVLYLQLWWSIYKDVPTEMAYGCYSGTTAEMISTNGYPDQWQYLFYPFQNIDGPICMNRTIKWIFLSFLMSLQVLSLIWFGMIVRVAVGVLRTGNAEDTRSDDEDEVEAGGQVQISSKDGTNGTAVVSETTNVEWRRSNASSTARPRGRGRLPLEQSDRKALLGRIGCDKPT